MDNSEEVDALRQSLERTKDEKDEKVRVLQDLLQEEANELSKTQSNLQQLESAVEDLSAERDKVRECVVAQGCLQ